MRVSQVVGDINHRASLKRRDRYGVGACWILIRIHEHVCRYHNFNMHEQSMNHISLKKYADSPTAQDALNKCQASSLHWGERKMGIAILWTEYSLMTGLTLDLAINLHHALTRYSAGSSRSYVVQKIIIWESCGGGGEADVRVDVAALQQQKGSKENWQRTDLHFAGNIIQSCTAGRKIFTGLVFIQGVREGVAIASADAVHELNMQN